MNLAQVIHQRWAGDGALSALLPASRLYTGMSVDPTPPYAVITRQRIDDLYIAAGMLPRPVTAI